MFVDEVCGLGEHVAFVNVHLEECCVELLPIVIVLFG